LRGRIVAMLVALAVMGAVLASPTHLPAPRTPHDAASSLGVVVSVDGIASRIGARVLERGGNAIDAAVATAFALAVTYPRAGNLGGGGFMMVRMADGRATMIDYREVAPAAAGPDTYVKPDGTVDEDAARLGYRAVGVPGTVAGLALAHREFGTLPWADLVAPALQVAEGGFRVDRDTAESLERAAEELARFPSSARIFLQPDGTALRRGDRLVQPDLAWTLGEIRRGGAPAFYEGAPAARIARDVARNGGLLDEADLRRYRATLRDPIRIPYRGRYEILAPGLPSSGGVTLAMMLRFLERFPVAAHGPDAPETVHLLAEAMRRAFRDRAAYLGDSDFVEVPLERLLSPEHVEPWVAAFRPDRATSSLALAGPIRVLREGDNTTHFSIVDRLGNIVSNTYTINYSYGSKAVADGTGILLNNEMDDFNLSDRTDDRGRIGTPANRIEPGKRMLSSMTPVIVLRDGAPFLVAGSPGGKTIISTVLRVLVNVLDFGMPARDAVDAPRFHHEWLPDELLLEEGRFPEATVRALRALGHQVRFSEFQGDAHCVLVEPDRALLRGAADLRIDGAAVGVGGG